MDEGKMSENIEKSNDDLIKRKKKLINFLKQKKDWAYLLVLSVLVFINVYIRTRNIPRLKDITTGTWTLGPDLDPFLFLRWAKDIVKNGSLMLIDNMRNVPLGFNTAGEAKLLPYLIAWFYHFLSFFSNDVTVTYAAIILPVVMSAFAAIAFFLFARKIFYKQDKKTKNIIALISTAFFIVIPSLLPRTIAGIPEKESVSFFLLFITFYFFMEAITSKKLKKGLFFGILSGISTSLFALIWGGVLFVFFTIPSAILLTFILGKIKKREFFIYSSWMIFAFLLTMPFSTRYTLKNIIFSTSSGFSIGVWAILGISLFFIMNNNKLEKIRKRTKLPQEAFSLLSSIIILIVIMLITLGPGFIFNQLSNLKTSLISPTATSRFGLTVAENRQPYFAGEWKGNFGPVVFNIPLYFWLFIIGSVTLFANMINKLKKKEKIILIFSYFIFLISLIFSRYSQTSKFNGVSPISIFFYFFGAILFLGTFGYFYYKKYNEGNFHIFREFDFNYILYFIILTLGIIGARGGIRLIMMLGAVSPVAVSFLIIKSSKEYLKEKDEAKKILRGIIAGIVIIASVFTLIGNPLLMFNGTNFWNWGGYYQQVKLSADNFAPGAYQFQWQNAMAWVRENTTEDAVFAHWWDYGYWLQSIGERATVLDGGNAITYWDYFMGRFALTGTDELEALNFLYTHNTTHFLIDSTDIGKYTAFSSIGSDKDYDRYSWISTFLMDPQQTQESKNQTLYFYRGGSLIDDDIIWEQDKKEIFLPAKNAGIGAVILKINSDNEILQPEGIFVYNGNQYRIPLRYAYINKKLIDFKSGLESGVYVFPSLNAASGGGVTENKIGAMLYLSNRTIHSQLANLYLFNKKSDYFKLVHTQDSLIVDNLKQQGLDIENIVYYQGLQGPIKIWEINYPEGIKANPEYLEKIAPREVTAITKGEYN